MTKCQAINCKSAGLFTERLSDGRIVKLCPDCLAAVRRPWRPQPTIGDETDGTDKNAGSDKRADNRSARDAAPAVPKLQGVAEDPDGNGEA